jgi:hypothetical protein
MLDKDLDAMEERFALEHKRFLEERNPSVLRGQSDADSRHCKALQARREVRRLPHNAPLLRLSRADEVADHHQSRRNANARLQSSVGLQIAYGSNQRQPCAHRSLCIVLTRLRVTEEDEDTVPRVLRDIAAEPLHGLRDTLLVRRNDLPEVLGVHAGRKGRRAHQVREHHGDLTPLGSFLGGSARRSQRGLRVT